MLPDFKKDKLLTASELQKLKIMRVALSLAFEITSSGANQENKNEYITLAVSQPIYTIKVKNNGPLKDTVW